MRTGGHTAHGAGRVQQLLQQELLHATLCVVLGTVPHRTTGSRHRRRRVKAGFFGRAWSACGHVQTRSLEPLHACVIAACRRTCGERWT